MISLLLLVLTGAQAAPDRLLPPTAAEVAQAQMSLRREADADKAAIDAAIERRLLGGGYFQLVTDKREQQSAAARFQGRLGSVGIPASVGDCHWIGLVAAGTANGNHSYGGACSVRMGSGVPSDFLICEADLGGVTLIQPEWFAYDATYIEIFIRRACL